MVRVQVQTSDLPQEIQEVRRVCNGFPMARIIFSTLSTQDVVRLAEEAGFAKSNDLIGWGPRNVLLLDEKEHVEVDQDDEDCEIDENL